MIKTDIQKPEINAIIDLYTIDITLIGGASPYYFYSGVDNNYGSIVFQGITYSPWAVEVKNFKKSSGGKMPRPVLRLGNVDGFLSSLNASYQDLIGTKVTRKRTLAQYLDAPLGSTPDPNAVLTESYYIDAKRAENNEVVEYELASSLDITGKKLPGRVMVASTCLWRYLAVRNGDPDGGCDWDPGGAHPANYYDADDNPTTQANDVCGKKLSSCQVRFGTNAELPFGGFPSTSKT